MITTDKLRKMVTIQVLAVGRAARAINGLVRYRAGEGARGTPYSKVLNSYEKSYIILIIRVICIPLHLMVE
ncbi:MAG: hypothetical protein EPN89_07355 [Methylovulum sp.]|nr:MAG: hypothetical protein EPN89_07355 [Methylovulum sp.]